MVQFRKSKKVGPFRFTLTQRGISTSAGAGPLRLSRGSDGRYRRTIRVPGVGLYDTKVVGQAKAKPHQASPVKHQPHGQPPRAASSSSDVPVWIQVAVAIFAVLALVFLAVILYLVFSPVPHASADPAPYYSSCKDANADGRYDIPSTDPAYRSGLDRDHDGVACESTAGTG